MIAPIYPVYVRNPDGNIQVDERGLTVYDFGSSTTLSAPVCRVTPWEQWTWISKMLIQM